ncbi:MAG: hypothetical protein IT445_07275 [Phycisphaeraceae bacterium]|nr:hypothetical protein [Phycisphaeraceae bacterium]
MAAARFIIGMVLLFLLLGAAVWVFVAMNSDDNSKLICLTFGLPDEQTVEVHAEITTLMSSTDVMPYSIPEGGIDWPRWTTDHFVIRDPSGSQVPVHKAMRSSLVGEAVTRGLTDSFVVARVQKGVDYTYLYIPVVGGPEQYLYSFTAPDGPAERLRVRFEAIE